MRPLPDTSVKIRRALKGGQQSRGKECSNDTQARCPILMSMPQYVHKNHEWSFSYAANTVILTLTKQIATLNISYFLFDQKKV